MNFTSHGKHAELQRAYRYQVPARSEGLPTEDPIGSRANLASHGAAPDVIALGMKLFLASLMMIFGATFVAYGIFRWRERADWEGILNGPELMALAAATVFLVLADIATARALKKAETRAAASRLTLLAAIFASIYMVVQGTSWVPILSQVGERINGSIVGGTLKHAGGLFLMLTFAHAIHVLGGIVANVTVLVRSKGGKGPQRDSLRMLHSYWRFLTVMWVAVLALLAI